MAKQLTTVPSDSPCSGTTISFDVPSLNYGEDFRALVDDAGHVELTNVSAPLDAPETITMKQTTIKNVYSGTGIETASQSSIKKGINLMTRCREVWRLTDDADSTYEVLLPVSCHFVTNIPVHSEITAEQIVMLQLRAIAAQYDVSSDDKYKRLEQMIRGALMPAAL